MPKVTQALEKKFERLNAKLDDARDAVYASVNNNTTPFNQCLVNASLVVKDAYAAADRARFDFMLEMVHTQRRAYFESSGNYGVGTFNWYR